MTYREFFIALRELDWYYSFSDDYSVYRRGRDALQELEHYAEESSSPVPLAMLKAWEEHRFSGEAFGTKPTPEPELKDFKP